jgi:hypothetical protein
MDLSSTKLVTIELTNVNDIFYSYGMNCTATMKDSGLSQVINVLVGAGIQTESAEVDCNAQALNLVKAVNDYLKTPANCNSDCTSVGLKETESMLAGFRQQIDARLKCGTLSMANHDLLTALNTQLKMLLTATHVVTFPATLSPDYDYSCAITEYYNQQPTKNGTMTIAIKPRNTILTLSIGPLFSAIRNRSYSSVSVPNADSTGTQTVLGLQGNSFSSAIAALVNFRVPIQSLASDNFGLDIAAGPVLRLNSKSSTSPAGFFAGVSLRFYRYLFLTPGVHVGDFADFPPGFRPGQLIPPNFPAPTAATRTTAKFAIAISFQTKDFSSVGKSTATATTPPAPVPAQKPNSGIVVSNTGVQPVSGGSETITLAGTAGSPVNVNLGALGSTAITKTLTVKNGTGMAMTLSFSKQDPTNQLDIPASNPCGSLAAGAVCSLTITLKPGQGNPPATLNISLPDGTQQAVVLSWTK